VLYRLIHVVILALLILVCLVCCVLCVGQSWNQAIQKTLPRWS